MVSRKPRESVCAVCRATHPHCDGRWTGYDANLRERAGEMPDRNDKRLAHLVRFYSVIATLESNIAFNRTVGIL